MSSRRYASELTPDSRLYRLLLLAAALTAGLGLMIICYLPVQRLVCAAGALAWCSTTGREFALLWTSQRRVLQLRLFADGSVELRTPAGVWLAATLEHGCVVLRRLAWFRLRLADGRRCVTVVRGDARQSEQWRRLQVIWRHLGTAG